LVGPACSDRVVQTGWNSEDIEPKGVRHMDIPGYMADQG
jgi:hypothetical protein